MRTAVYVGKAIVCVIGIAAFFIIAYLALGLP